MGALILAFVGVVFLIGGAHQFVQHLQARRGVVVTGTIVDVQVSQSESTDSDGTTTWQTFYKPIVEYTGPDGRAHRVIPNVAGGVPPRIGDTRQVAYPPDDPARAVLVSAGGERATKWVFLLVGLAACAGAVAVAAT